MCCIGGVAGSCVVAICTGGPPTPIRELFFAEIAFVGACAFAFGFLAPKNGCCRNAGCLLFLLLLCFWFPKALLRVGVITGVSERFAVLPASPSSAYTSSFCCRC